MKEERLTNRVAGVGAIFTMVAMMVSCEASTAATINVQGNEYDVQVVESRSPATDLWMDTGYAQEAANAFGESIFPSDMDAIATMATTDAAWVVLPFLSPTSVFIDPIYPPLMYTSWVLLDDSQEVPLPSAGYLFGAAVAGAWGLRHKRSTR